VTQTNAENTVATAVGRGTLTPRTISRKLLARKAAARAGDSAEEGEALEDAFPAEDAALAGNDAGANTGLHDDAAPGDVAAGHASDPAIANNLASAPDANNLAPPEQSEGSPSGAALGSATCMPAALPAWSSEDERTFQAMLARRKAAGYQRRGKDVSAQLIRAGDIAPNPDTVVATIVGLVRQAGGQVARGALLDAMAGAAYAHPKAQPGNRGWCQGYVAGALRDGFLAEANEAACGAGDVLDGQAGAGAAVIA
jgi:hypothetical protein